VPEGVTRCVQFFAGVGVWKQERAAAAPIAVDVVPDADELTTRKRARGLDKV
jgi:hypothetical protein